MKQLDRQILLDQEDIITKAARKFQVTEMAKPLVPMEPAALLRDKGPTLPDGRLFQQLIGTLNYLSGCTRPDLAFSVALLSRRMRNPTCNDLQLVKKCLAYVYHNRSRRMQYRKIDRPCNLRIYVDSS